MILLLSVSVPLAAAVLYVFLKNVRLKNVVFALAAAGHFVLSTMLLCADDCGMELKFHGSTVLCADYEGTFLLWLTSLLFALFAIHFLCWLPREKEIEKLREKKNVLLSDAVTVPAVLLFLATMTLVILAGNFGLFWVALEATTLASAPLICFYRKRSSLEAMWKYLLICSVGIALALFGILLLAVSGIMPNGENAGLDFATLAERREFLNLNWFKAAFIFALAGFGSKMGLAPFHTWLPDAYSEAPGPLTALMSGTLVNCSFLGLIRFTRIAPDALQYFCSTMLTAIGLFSVAVAAIFIIRQNDFKRMLAYSSVEHMGLAAILWGLGATDVTLLHISAHSFIKMTLFLLAGNIIMTERSRSISGISGLFTTIPRNAVLFLIGILFICGTPPSPLFVTEFMLVKNAPLWLGMTVLLLLFTILAGMSQACLKMVMGKASAADGLRQISAKRSEELTWIPMAVIGIMAVAGLFMLYLANCGRI